VNELLARAGALFLAPERPRLHAATVPAADLVGVLAAPPDLAAVAGGIAAQLRRRHRARTALVCRPGPLNSAPAVPAARALARRLCGRDVPAAAGGGLCHVALGDGEDAVRDLWRAITAAAGHPAVVALPARTDALDGFLAETDQLYLAQPPGAEPEYTEAALASLAALGPPVACVAPPQGVVARRAAALGLRALAPAPAGVPA
jgi:hypothetical protein